MKRICFFWERCLPLHTACCSQWCSRKLPTQLAHQGTHGIIITISGHSVLICFVIACMSVCVGLCGRGWEGTNVSWQTHYVLVGGQLPLLLLNRYRVFEILWYQQEQTCLSADLKLTQLMWVCVSTSARLFDFISKKLNETLQLTAAPLHKIQVGRTNPYTKTTQPSVCSIKDHFSVLQQHRGQQRLALALIVALSYLPVSFSFALSPQGSKEMHNGHSGISLFKKVTSPEGWGHPALRLPNDVQPETLGK